MGFMIGVVRRRRVRYGVRRGSFDPEVWVQSIGRVRMIFEIVGISRSQNLSD